MTQIQLRVPAQPEYAFLVRRTTAAVMGLSNVGYDYAEEWPLAIDEAFALAINHRPNDGEVLIDFELVDGQVIAKVTGPTGSSEADLKKAVCQLGWDLITACVPKASSTVDEAGRVTVTLDSRVVASA